MFLLDFSDSSYVVLKDRNTVTVPILILLLIELEFETKMRKYYKLYHIYGLLLMSLSAETFLFIFVEPNSAEV